MWSMRGGGDPRLEEYERPVTGGLNRWIVRHPILAPVIGFAITGVLLAVAYFTGGLLISRLAIIPLVTSVFLLIYGLIRKATDISGRKQAGDEAEELPPEEPMEVDERARRQAVARWKERAKREAEERQRQRC